jgi:hypothetical protein
MVRTAPSEATLREIVRRIVVVTPEELERNQHQVGTVIRPALREGRLVYDRAA